MKLRTPAPMLIVRFALLLALFTASGCQWIVDFDRSKIVDAGPDTGTPDAGAADAGMMDAGAMDAGTMDAGTMDAGATDAGADGGP